MKKEGTAEDSNIGNYLFVCFWYSVNSSCHGNSCALSFLNHGAQPLGRTGTRARCAPSPVSMSTCVFWHALNISGHVPLAPEKSQAGYGHRGQPHLQSLRTIFFFFLCSTGFELSVSCFLGRHSTTWTTPLALLCVVFFQDRVSWTICLDWLQTTILVISASWVARTTGKSHRLLLYSTHQGSTLMA
jgi:hypothetical protein